MKAKTKPLDPALSVRDKVFQTALRLFNEHGIHQTGIDRIIAESGVAKKSFYNHFPSKNKLIAEYFAVRDQISYDRLVAHSNNSEASPLENALGLFDGLETWFKQKDFYGCSFIKALAEFENEPEHIELRACIDAHFAKLSKLIEERIKPVRPKDYKEFTPQILSLMIGAIVLAHANHSSAPAITNKKMARILLTSK